MAQVGQVRHSQELFVSTEGCTLPYVIIVDVFSPRCLAQVSINQRGMIMNLETDETNGITKDIDKTDNDLCRALWISVIVQAMIDIGARATTIENKRRRSDVLKWLGQDPEAIDDFETVCSLAGLEPSAIRKIMRDILRGKGPSIDFRATKRALAKNRGQEDRKRYFRRARKNQQNRLIAKSENLKAQEAQARSVLCGLCNAP